MNTKTTDLKSVILGLFFTCIISILSYSQNVGINGTGNAPDASAMLDIDASNKGLLIPRVALTGTTDAATIASPATSLLVYNTATAGGVTPGYYYNSGTTVSPVWSSFSSIAKFQYPIGAWDRKIFVGDFRPLGSMLSGVANDVLTGATAVPSFAYGSGATPVNASSARSIADAFFVATSTVKFNGATLWFNASEGDNSLSFYLYKKSGQTSGSGIVANFTQISSTVVVPFSAGSNVYQVNFPATSETLQPGDLLYLFVKVNNSMARIFLSGSIEFTY